MLAAERRAARTRKTLAIAIGLSLVLHALLLFFPLLRSQPLGGSDASPYRVYAPLQARIYKRGQAAAQQPAASQAAQAPQAQQMSPASPQRGKARILTSPKGNWHTAQRPAAPSRPLSGSELAQRALAMARSMGSADDEGGADAESTRQEGRGRDIEPLSLQWYFDSFINKLNRSARFVHRAPPPKGQHAAEVEIIINRDGSLHEYRVVRAADRQIEIDYIKAVVDRAVPFAAFPPEIGSKTDTLSLTICIQPPGDPGGGFGFTRTGGKHC